MEKLKRSYNLVLQFFITILLKSYLVQSLDFTLTNLTESCASQIYCQGNLLDTIQRARIFSDSKTFVDMSLTSSPEVILQNFEILMNSTNGTPSKKEILKFINDYFTQSDELETWTPDDYTENPKFLERIKDKEIRQFASDLVKIWPSLGRKVKKIVFEEPEKFSLIGVPNGVIIPGGRFREFYYWDSYWIIKGLLLGEMSRTAKGMIENLLYMVEKYGFVPNGGRVYYLNRSQPPLLTHMAALYLSFTGDIKWMQKIIPSLEKELNFWIKYKTITVKEKGKAYRLARYISNSDTPRPESYYEDVVTCEYFIENVDRKHCYQGLKSGAESGWDFSSRWFFDEDGGVKTNLTHIDAQRVIPVDLNAFLCSAFKILASFYSSLGDTKNSQKWTQLYTEWLISIEELLYNNQDGIWYDYDTVLRQHRKMFFPSNFVPLWTGSYNLALKNKYGQNAAQYFNVMKIGQFKGGIPASLDDNNEQWDFPNAWPPLQEFVILGLWNTGNKMARKIALRATDQWIYANLKGYREQTAMFEKYDAINVGQYGGGGEYEVQKGFGWTNGVALNLINIFYTGVHRRRKVR